MIDAAYDEGRDEAFGRVTRVLEDLYRRWGLNMLVHPLEESATDEQLAEAHEAVSVELAKD